MSTQVGWEWWTTHTTMCFFSGNFVKFQPEKYDFNLYIKDFSRKSDPNLPDFKDNSFQIF
jgi:hypothetical protein